MHAKGLKTKLSS